MRENGTTESLTCSKFRNDEAPHTRILRVQPSSIIKRTRTTTLQAEVLERTHTKDLRKTSDISHLRKQRNPVTDVTLAGNAL